MPLSFSPLKCHEKREVVSGERTREKDGKSSFYFKERKERGISVRKTGEK